MSHVLVPVPPFAVPSVPVRSPVEIEVVETSLPVLSVPKSAFVMPEKYWLPVVVALTASVDEAMSCAVGR